MALATLVKIRRLRRRRCADKNSSSSTPLS
jgi:hypothetical protein